MLKVKNFKPRFFAKKAGLPPGDIDQGERGYQEEETDLCLIRYHEGGFTTEKAADLNRLTPGAEQERLWLRVRGLGDIPLLKKVCDAIGIHKLHLEDILSPYLRPKLEKLSRGLFFVGTHYEIEKTSELFSGSNISIFFSDRLLVTFESQKDFILDAIEERIVKRNGVVHEKSLNYLFYALLDILNDSHYVVLDTLSEALESLEELVMKEPGPATLNRLYHVRKIVLDIKKNIWSFREVSAKLNIFWSREEEPDLSLYRADLHDHVAQCLDMVETMREMISGLVELHMSAVSNRMNEVMKILTIAGSIFIPLTFIAGVYGMNFDFMPELKWRFGYPAILIIMSLLAAGMLIFFKKKKWF
ncbi:magnesium/cobalt transporter CorA [Candidatus Mcinerneyibacteriota bacterium]|nr:magnesium/cobalt transporter CorA [Candidatus Mcinerneyibacteriota bacterium]